MKRELSHAPKFSLGEIVLTDGVLSLIDHEEVEKALIRHESADWGSVCPEDWTANNESLDVGARLLSSYVTAIGVTFWVISEADRSATTVLLPEEY